MAVNDIKLQYIFICGLLITLNYADGRAVSFFNIFYNHFKTLG